MKIFLLFLMHFLFIVVITCYVVNLLAYLIFDTHRRVMRVVLCLCTISPFLTGLYEMENEITSNHLGFDFNLVEGLGNQLGSVPISLCRVSHLRL